MEVVKIIKMLSESRLPKNKYDPIYRYADVDFSGQEFLVHEDVLLYNLYKYSYEVVALYIALASVRNYADWIATGDTTLPTIYSPVELTDSLILKTDRLLRVEGDKIHFLYEEVPTEKEKWH